MANGSFFPAELALAGQYNLLIDGESAVFTEQNQTINLRIEVVVICVTPKPWLILYICSGKVTTDGECR